MQTQGSIEWKLNCDWFLFDFPGNKIASLIKVTLDICWYMNSIMSMSHLRNSSTQNRKKVINTTRVPMRFTSSSFGKFGTRVYIIHISIYLPLYGRTRLELSRNKKRDIINNVIKSK